MFETNLNNIVRPPSKKKEKPCTLSMFICKQCDASKSRGKQPRKVYETWVCCSMPGRQRFKASLGYRDPVSKTKHEECSCMGFSPCLECKPSPHPVLEHSLTLKKHLPFNAHLLSQLPYPTPEQPPAYSRWISFSREIRQCGPS